MKKIHQNPLVASQAGFQAVAMNYRAVEHLEKLWAKRVEWGAGSWWAGWCTATSALNGRALVIDVSKMFQMFLLVVWFQIFLNFPPLLWGRFPTWLAHYFSEWVGWNHQRVFFVFPGFKNSNFGNGSHGFKFSSKRIILRILWKEAVKSQP